MTTIRKPFTIKQLLLLAFLLAGLLPATLVSFLSYFQARDALKKEISHDLQTLSTAVSSDVERILFERVQNVNSWSQLAIMQDLLIGDVDKRLSIFLSETQKSYHQEYRDLYVINLDGTVVAASNPSLISKKTPTPTVWFKVKLTTAPVSVAQLQNGKLGISQQIVNSQSGEIIGTLIANFDWSMITQLLNNSVGDATSAALLTSGETPHQSQVLAATNNWGEQGHALHATSALNGSLGLPHWQIRIEKSHSIAVAPVHRLAYVFLLLLFVTLLFSLFLVRPIAHAITKPLEQLTMFVRQFHYQALQKNSSLKQSQLLNMSQISAPKVGPPELQELSQAFDMMIKELEQSQQQLSRAAKLAVVGEMAAAMSHEVRTPLGIMRSSADVLLREAKLSKDGREVLGFIISETERLNKLVSSLIDAARPRPPALTNVNLVDIVHHVISLLKSQSQQKEIQVIFAPCDKMPVLADADQMTQVLMNLLMNAIQILPNKGIIEVHLTDHSDQIMLDVLDNGPGIVTENQAQIFEPFFTQRAGGVGLGLAVVKQIVEAHGGEIHYQTSTYGGAQFSINLPKVLG